MRTAKPMTDAQVTQSYDAHINLVDSFRTGTGARQAGFSIPRPSVEMMRKTIAKGVEIPASHWNAKNTDGLVTVVTK